MPIGRRLGDEALRREISHEHAAEMIGVSQATFSRWVNGTNLPGSPYFTRIARFLRTNRDEVSDAIAAERLAGDQSDSERFTALERDVRELRGLLGRIADHLGIDP